MNSILNSRKCNGLRRMAAWLLITAMMISNINPLGLVAAKGQSGNHWDVSYSVSKEEDDSIKLGDDSGMIALSAAAGEEIFFTMQLLLLQDEGNGRFKETFNISMPEAIYDALTGANGEPDEWFESDETDCGYLLELKSSADRASGSNAKHSDSDASDSNAKNGMISLQFQFVGELRYQKDSAGVEVSQVQQTLSFAAPADMLLTCSGDGNDCQLYMATTDDIMLLDTVVTATTAAQLQNYITNASSTELTTIKIAADIELSSTIIIPTGKNIILADNGIARTISAKSGEDLTCMFEIQEGATLIIDGDLTLDGTILTEATGDLRIIRNYGKLVLDHGTLSNSPAIAVTGSAAEFTMNGGVICNNQVSKTSTVLIEKGAHFELNGGSIRDNVYQAVRVTGESSGDTTMIMNGGEISNNTTNIYLGESYGGGVYVGQYSDFTMNGGIIKDNVANVGGGIYVGFNTSKFVLDGGTITGNRGGYQGGGIYIKTSNAELKKGLIIDNKSDTWGISYGGGLYLEAGSSLTLENVLVTNNYAEERGGGVWSCPTGNSKNYILYGGAVYGNTAGDSGDDVEISTIKENGRESALIERMLGGGAVEWYLDNPDQRYQAGDPKLEGDDLVGITTLSSFKALVSAEAAALAEANAKVIITGNTSTTAGGGIATNGTLLLGDHKSEPQKLKVYKAWETETNQQVEVEIQLVIDGYEQDKVKLNASNSWTAYFEGLPEDIFENRKVEIKEIAVNGLTPFYSEITKSATEENTYEITVTNRKSLDQGELAIRKKVVGGSSGEKFTFTVYLKDSSQSPLTASFDYYDGNGIRIGTIKNGDQIELGDGDVIVIKNLPSGTNYEVVEADNADYLVTSTNEKGLLNGNKGETATFINTRISKLSITKTVAEGGEKNKKFTFTVALRDTVGALSGEFNYKITPGTATGKISSGQSILLSHGETAVIEGLPANTRYTVTESDNENYKVEYSGESGTITGGQDASVTVTNTIKTGSDTLAVHKKLITGSGAQVSINGKIPAFHFAAKLIETKDKNGIPTNSMTIAYEDNNSPATLTVGGSLTAVNDDDGLATFPELVFAKQGTYIFELKEANNGKPQFTYDTSTYYAKVVVTDGADQLNAAVYYYTSSEYHGNGSDIPKVEFTNTYEAETSINLELKKQLLDQGNNPVTPVPTYTFKVTVDSSGATTGIEIPAGMETVTNDANGVIKINGIKFTKAGIYVVKVAESASGVPTGIEVDIMPVMVTITVTQADDGTLTAKAPAYSNNNKTFTNKVKAVNLVFEGEKVLNNKALAADSFKFIAVLAAQETGSTVKDKGTVKSVGDSFAPVGNASIADGGKISFKNISVDKAGTYIFEITEDTSANDPTITYDSAPYYAEVTVIHDTVTGVLKQVTPVRYYSSYDADTDELSEELTAGMVFTNSYKPLKGDTEFSLNKKLIGADGTEITTDIPAYQFQLSQDLSIHTIPAVMKQTTATNDYFGRIKFTGIEFTEEGTYIFKVTEIEGLGTGITYSTEVATVTVTVTDEDGQLTAVSVYDLDGVNGEKTFTNTIKAVNDRLEARKTLTGGTLSADAFDFTATLIAPAGATVSSGGRTLTVDGDNTISQTNDEQGVVAFDEITFNQVGEYIFAITENRGTTEGLLYDETNYYAKVSVTAKLDQSLDTVVSYYTDEACETPVTTDSEVPEFVNNYYAEIDLELAKKLLDASAETDEKLPLDEDHPYTFTIELVEEDGNCADVIITEPATASNAADGAVVFHGIRILKAGTYTFKITEDTLDQGHGHSGTVVTDPGEILATVVVAEINGRLEQIGTAEYVKTEPAGSEHHYDSDESEKDTTFINFWKPEEKTSTASISLQAYKNLIGREPGNQEFSFKSELISAPDGVTMPDKFAANDQDGTVKFPACNFDTTGTYIFAITEVAGDDNSVKYSDSVYYAKVVVIRNRMNELDIAEAYYGTFHDEETNDVSGNILEPSEIEFVNTIRGYVRIEKVSYGGNRPLQGAEFELSRRIAGSDGEWVKYGETLVTAGAQGSVTLELPDDYTKYEYQLIETKAPSGYSKTRVGTIIFTMALDGTIAEFDTTGTAGYVILSESRTTIIAKNHTGGGGGGGGGETPKTPEEPKKPEEPGNPDTPTTTTGDNDTPLAQMLSFLEGAIPLSGLVKTGDMTASVLTLLAVMLIAGSGLAVIVYCRKKQK